MRLRLQFLWSRTLAASAVLGLLLIAGQKWN